MSELEDAREADLKKAEKSMQKLRDEKARLVVGHKHTACQLLLHLTLTI